MWIVQLLKYARLKAFAVLIRTVVTVQIRVRRNILRTFIDWEVSFPKASRVYSIPSSDKSSGDITVRLKFAGIIVSGITVCADVELVLRFELGILQQTSLSRAFVQCTSTSTVSCVSDTYSET